jgi:hypothetical protein
VSTKELRGIGGWLLVIGLFLAITSAWGWLQIIAVLVTKEYALPMVFFALDVVLTFWETVVVVMLFACHPLFVSWAKFLFVARMGMVVVSFFVMARTAPESIVFITMASLLGFFINYAMLQYVLNSERVKDTYLRSR